MSDADVNMEMSEYDRDQRPACQYGLRCYQKNAFHRKKYKHPPKNARRSPDKDVDSEKVGRKRKIDERDGSGSPEKEREKVPGTGKLLKVHDISSSDENENNDEAEKQDTNEKQAEEADAVVRVASRKNPGRDDDSKISKDSKNSENAENAENSENLGELEEIGDDKILKISEIFSFKMPDDFYRLYNFCAEVSKDDPANALKVFKLKLVGPYDVLTGTLTSYRKGDKETYLRYWRYYYDPPEFQTVIKGNDKTGLHFGYWRDDPAEDPVFVAKNKAEVNCIIEPVAENVFGAVNAHMEAEIKTANPFEKNSMVRLQKRLKAFASSSEMNLERSTLGMRSREKRVVTRTFHKAGIVVPFDRKTQLGYRDLAASDSALKKILEAIDSAADDEDLRNAQMSKLDEVVRWATIAGDECDFGTCLELAHDLFASGHRFVQNTALRMFRLAYAQLGRTIFYDVARAHLQSRRRPR